MKITILALSLIFSGVVLTQNDTLNFEHSKFRIGVKGLFEKRNGGIAPRSEVFNFGVPVIYKFGRNSSLETGVYYLKRIMFDASIIRATGCFNTDYEPNTLHIPLKYRLDIKVVSHFFIYGSIGLYGEYILSRSIPSENTCNVTFDNDRNFMYGMASSFGLETSISYKINLFIELEHTTNISSPYKGKDGGFLSGNISLIPDNYGVGIGVNYKL